MYGGEVLRLNSVYQPRKVPGPNCRGCKLGRVDLCFEVIWHPPTGLVETREEAQTKERPLLWPQKLGLVQKC